MPTKVRSKTRPPRIMDIHGARQVFEEKFLESFSQLNSEQKQAVEAIEGPVMVLAGPGTGKTQVLAMRIANILRETQIDPWNILCLTFTESGVVAMRERLLSIIGTPAYAVRIHTFHSFCNEIIQDHPDIFALARDWRVLSDVERIELIQSILDELPGTSKLKPMGHPYMFVRDIAGNIQALKQEDISPKSLKHVLDSIETFVGSIQKEIAVFHVLKAAQRSDAACEAMYKKVKRSTEEARLPVSLKRVVDTYYETFQKRLRESDTKRQLSSARTAFKNDLKHWIDKQDRQLPKQKDMQKAYAQYQEYTRRDGRYDYEDMITMVVKAWQGSDQLLAQYQEQFQYILVDEYQDTNGAQNEILSLLGSFDERPNMFVVGDDKQSIYRFQGASLNNMLTFYEKYRRAETVISLRQNYRSGPHILEAAGTLIAHNKESLTKYIPNLSNELVPASMRAPFPLKVVTYRSEDEEDYYVVQHVADLLAKGAEPEAIAVLFRYNRDGHQLLRMMRQKNIPARLEAGENILADPMIRQFLTLLRYLADSGRDNLLAELIQYEWWPFDDVDTLKAIHLAGSRRRELLMVLSDKALLMEGGVQHPNQFVEFIDRLATWKRQAAQSTLQDTLTRLVTESGLIAKIQHEHDGEGLQKLTTLLEEAKRFNQGNPRATLAEFVANIQLLIDHGVSLTSEPWQGQQKAVRLMTAHKAKGLEFEHVIITRCNDKHWGNNPEPTRVSLPHGLVRYDMVLAQENNEDERRLFYVALTRAKKAILLSRAAYSTQGKETVPSLFIRELPPETLDYQEAAEGARQTLDRLVASTLAPVPKVSREATQEWLRGLLKSYVMSVTHLNNYLECPYKFYVKNILQVPSARSPSQALGTAVHGALDDLVRHLHAHHTALSKQEFLKHFEQHLQREILTETQVKDLRAIGKKYLSSYYNAYRSTFSKNALAEYSFGSHGVHVAEVPITGRVDKVELLNEEDIDSQGRWREGAAVNVTDYKTGDPVAGARRVKLGGTYHRQLVFYKLLCDHSPRFPYRMASGEIDFVQPTENGTFVKKRLEISGEEASALVTVISRVWQEVQDLQFLNEEKYCGKCEVCTSAVKIV